GLGNRISEPAFEGQFKGVDVRPKIEYIKNRKPEKPNQIQAITGATISSNAVVTNLNNAIAKVVSSFPVDEIRKAAHEPKHEDAGKKEGGDGK
ncbi:MAG TPA: FMN-binding protein, partial [Thermodesulfobacteriota bacterium]|nr:FMN-binding protein [Thermodesulfobacteriota bacterium]